MILKSEKQPATLLFLVLLTGVVAMVSFSVHNDGKPTLVKPAITPQSPFNTIELVFKEKHYKRIAAKRNNAVAAGVLQTETTDYVPVKVYYKGEPYKGEARLKGDWVDHLEGNKWSYRVKLTEDKTIMGLRKFSIHHPKTRGYLNEWLFHKAIKDEDVIGLRYDFLEGFVHHGNAIGLQTINAGIYAIEETFDKLLIESNQRKVGVILKLTEEDMWRELALNHDIATKTGVDFKDTYNPKYGVDMKMVPFEVKKVLGDPIRRKQFVLAKNLLNKFKNNQYDIAQVFNLEKVAMYTVLSNLFGGQHGLAAHNLRFFYNPISSRIEPIAFDAVAGYKITTFRDYWKNGNHPLYQEAKLKALKKVTAPNYLTKLLEAYKEDIGHLQDALNKEFANEPLLALEAIEANAEVLRQVLLEMEQLK